MGIRIIYGKPGTGKSTFCFLEIAKNFKKEKKIYMITPEQFSYTAEKKLMEAVSTKSVLQAEVLTLSRMAYRVLNEVGRTSKTTLSKAGKAMLIYSLFNQGKKELKFLGKTDETIELVMSMITELKKHSISIEMLKKEIEESEDPYLKAKLEDITYLYEKFEEQIQNQLIEENDLLTLLANHLDETDFLTDSVIYLDEFAGFTKQEYNVIGKIMEQAKQVNITICTDSLEKGKSPDSDIFYSNKKTVSKIIEQTNQKGIKLEDPVYLEKEYRFKTKELQAISQYFNKIPTFSDPDQVENLQLFLAKNPYSEIEEVAKKIIKLVQKEKKRYQEIALITQNLEEYATLVRVIFSQYKIPVFIDEKRDLNQNSIIQYGLAILEILSKNFSSETIFHFLKLGFCELEMDEIVKLENYAIKWGIKNNQWKKEFIYEKETKKQEIERLEEMRSQIIVPLLALKERIGKERTIENITKQFYLFLQEQNLEQKITQKIQQLEKESQIDLAKEYQESYQTLIQVLNEMNAILGKETMTVENYGKILKVGLQNSGLGKIPGTQDQVTLGDVDRSRTHEVKTVFIIGMNDGSFPSVKKDEGFLKDEDREKLKQKGMELANGTLDQLYEDQFNCYRAFTTAQEKIHLSYCSSDREGKSLRPSMLLHKIKRMFPKLREQSDLIEKNYEMINEEITYQELIENLANLKNKEAIDEIWLDVYQYFQTQDGWKQKLDQDIQGLFYTNLPTKIKQKTINQLYGDTLNTSVSKLEKYRSCPFSYYLQYGLKLKEQEELKVRAFDTGSFMHETIDQFFEEVRSEKIGLAQLEEKEIEKRVAKIIDQNLNQTKNAIFTATAKYKVLVKRLKKMVSKALKYIIQTIINSDFTIEGSEIEFSQTGKYSPIIFNLEDGKQVKITGKIDRVDTANGEDGKYLRIIDYKSSSQNIDLNEVYAGIQIQLLTYMDAIGKEENCMPAGIFYFSLLEQMIKADKKMQEEEIEEMIRKNFRMKGLIVADVKVIQMNDNTLTSGSSKLVPAAINSAGTVNEKWTSGVSKEEFRILQGYIECTIKQIAKEILSGSIDLKPYYKKGKTPCKYCAYQTICGFNPRQTGNEYQYIDRKTKDDMIRKMKETIKEEKNG